MSSRLRSELRRVALSTFEELGFVFPELELRDSQKEAPLAWGARVAFHGPVCGALEVRASDDVVGALTSNMLGLDDVDDRGVCADALGEMANVVCGNFVPCLGTRTDTFDLSAPEVYPAALDLSRPGVSSAAVLVCGVGEGRVELFVTIDAPVGTVAP